MTTPLSELAATLSEAQREDGWIPHDGRPCPVPLDSQVLVRYSGDPDTIDWAKWRSVRAGSQSWSRVGDGADIIAYRPAKEK